jgi:predicted RNase H-like nuclease (RuvC/YqgF family)
MMARISVLTGKPDNRIKPHIGVSELEIRIAEEVSLREQAELTVSVLQKELLKQISANNDIKIVLKETEEKIVQTERALSERKDQQEKVEKLSRELSDVKAHSAVLEDKITQKQPDDGAIQLLDVEIASLKVQLESERSSVKKLLYQFSKLEKAIADNARPPMIPKPPTYELEVTGVDINNRIKKIRLSPKE